MYNMRKTYAYNGIILGVLLGIVAGAYTDSVVLGVIAAIGASVICFLVIRAIENAISRGVDAASDKISEAFANRNKAARPDTRQHTPAPPADPIHTGAENIRCAKCGAALEKGAEFCTQCGTRVSEK